MNSARTPFIDWMKAIGIGLVVYGHIADSTIQHLTQPIYPKQLGVVFFLFVLGHSLARDQRPAWRSIFDRLFNVYLLGIGSMIVLSAINVWLIGNPNRSNYIPFVFGLNVVIDSFPANPTLWYVGTYVHLVVLGAFVLRRMPIRWWTLAMVALLEIAVRAVLIAEAGRFVAYQFLTNWLTVFVLGVWYGQRAPSPVVSTCNSRPLLAWLGALVAAPVIWTAITRRLHSQLDFPFMQLGSGSPALTLVVTSSAVTVLYVAYAVIVHGIARRLPDLAIVRFFARNTLLVFIWHMPLLYRAGPAITREVHAQWAQIAVGMVLYWLVLAVCSELVMRVIRPDRLRAPVLEALVRARSAPAETVRAQRGKVT